MLVMPRFLRVLFFTEMWERYSYYGMRALLVLFLTTKLGFKDENAYAIYALAAALSYVGPVIGGFIADKLLGFRYMVIIGAGILVIGHFTLAFVDYNQSLLYIGLGLICIGTGLFKGNISNLLGCCYSKNDPARESGFTIFYVSVNVGSLLASISCGYIAYKFGWHYGFGLAGIGMSLGLATFLYYQDVLGEHGLPNSEQKKAMAKLNFLNLNAFQLTFIFGILLAVLASFMLQNSAKFAKLLGVFGVFVILYLGYKVKLLKSEEKINIAILLILSAFEMIFFAFEMQLGAMFALFTDRNIDNTVFGLYIPATVSQAINPFSIILFGPLVAHIGFKLGRNWSLRRFGFGLATMIMCFGTIYLGCLNADNHGMVNYSYLFFGICLMGLGELCIDPLVINMYTTLSPDKMRGFLMGVYLLSLAFSNLAGNIIAKFMSIPNIDGEIDKIASLEIYKTGFLDIIYFNIYVLIGFIVIYPFLNKKVLRIMSGKLQVA